LGGILQEDQVQSRIGATDLLELGVGNAIHEVDPVEEPLSPLGVKGEAVGSLRNGVVLLGNFIPLILVQILIQLYFPLQLAHHAFVVVEVVHLGTDFLLGREV
jgi:hypothetical protein